MMYFFVENVENVLNVVLLVGAAIGGSVAFVCLIGCTYIVLKQQVGEDNKEKV